MNIRHLVALAAWASTALGCSGLTGIRDAGKRTATFSTQFVETTVARGNVVNTCSVTYTLAGTLTLKFNGTSDATIAGDGSVDATQTPVSATGGCGPGPSRTTAGPWTGPLTGTPSSFGFTTQRSNGTSFVVTTQFSFTGAQNASGVTGTLSFVQTGRGITGGSNPTNSDASATISVTLQ